MRNEEFSAVQILRAPSLESRSFGSRDLTHVGDELVGGGGGGTVGVDEVVVAVVLEAASEIIVGTILETRLLSITNFPASIFRKTRRTYNPKLFVKPRKGISEHIREYESGWALTGDNVGHSVVYVKTVRSM